MTSNLMNFSKQKKKTLPPEQGYRTKYVDFKIITYQVTIKELPTEVRLRFTSWLNLRDVCNSIARAEP